MIVADPNVDPQGLLVCKSIARLRSFAMVRYFAEIGSTNTAAMLDLETDQQTPRLYLTDQQHSGRGRQGRTWIADQGTLTFSLVIPTVKDKAHRLAPISIAVGVAMARTIEHLAAPFRARLKWPNDVYIDGGKVAGILIEATPAKHNATVIGVGLNVATDFSHHDLPIDSPVKSICELTQRYPHRYQWLAECVNQIFEAVDDLSLRPAEILAEQRRRCLLNGNDVRYLLEGKWILGHCEGIDDDGSLMVRAAGTLHRITGGEVHHIRRV